MCTGRVPLSRILEASQCYRMPDWVWHPGTKWKQRGLCCTSWGWAALRFYRIAGMKTGLTTSLVVGLGRSKTLWQDWVIYPAVERIEPGAMWEDVTMFELRTREDRGELPLLIDGFADPFFEKKYPAVGATLFSTTDSKGKVRKTGAFSMWRSPEGVTIKVSDGEYGEVYQFTSESFEKALARVEKALQEGMRGNKPQPEKKPRQRRK